MTIKRIEIKGLFDQFDYSIPLNTKDNVTVIGGANGSGKTTILKLLKAVLEVDCAVIADIPFRKFRLDTHDDSLLVRKETASLEAAEGKKQPTDFTEVWEKTPTNGGWKIPSWMAGQRYRRLHNVDYTQACRSMKLWFSGRSADRSEEGFPLELRALTPGSVLDTVLRVLHPKVGRWWVHERSCRSRQDAADIKSTNKFMRLEVEVLAILMNTFSGESGRRRLSLSPPGLSLSDWVVFNLSEVKRQDAEWFDALERELARYCHEKLGFHLASPASYDGGYVDQDNEIQEWWVKSWARSCADKVVLIPTTRLSQLTWVDQNTASPGDSEEDANGPQPQLDSGDVLKFFRGAVDSTDSKLRGKWSDLKSSDVWAGWRRHLKGIAGGIDQETTDQETLAVVRRFSREISARCREAMDAKSRSVDGQKNLALRFMERSQSATDVTRQDVEELRGRIKKTADNAAAMGFDPDLIGPEDEELVKKWKAAEEGEGGPEDQAIVRQLMYLTYLDKLDGWTPAIPFMDRAKIILRRMDRFFGGKKKLKIDGREGYYIETEAGGKHAVEELSSGELQQLVFTHFLVFFEYENGLVLIDEPEISLDVSWQDSYVKDMLEIAKELTLSVDVPPPYFILATHSPIIAERAPWEDYVELTHIELSSESEDRSSKPDDRMTRSIFVKLSQREFPIGHPYYGEKTGRGGVSFMGSIRDGTLDILSYIPTGARFDRARAYFDKFQALEKQYQQHKAAGGDCTKGSPGQDIRTRSQRMIRELIDSVLGALS